MIKASPVTDKMRPSRTDIETKNLNDSVMSVNYYCYSINTCKLHFFLIIEPKIVLCLSGGSWDAELGVQFDVQVKRKYILIHQGLNCENNNGCTGWTILIYHGEYLVV